MTTTQNRVLELAKTYATKCDEALLNWQKQQKFTNPKLGLGDFCQIYKGRKYYEIIRGRKNHGCHMGYIEIATGKLCKEQRQAARWELLDNDDAELLFNNLRPFGGHLYADIVKKIREAN